MPKRSKAANPEYADTSSAPPESATTETDDLESALARALDRARAAEKWDVVWLLTSQLEKRRRA